MTARQATQPTRRQIVTWGAGAALLHCATALAQGAAADELTGGDPLGSMQWPGLRKQYLGDAPMQFSDAVLVRGPAFADDAMNVPLLVDARALANVGGGVARIQVVVDRNPVRNVLTYTPTKPCPCWPFASAWSRPRPCGPWCKRAMAIGTWAARGSRPRAAGARCRASPGLTARGSKI
jgi:sulfur-oxidizing protein SoxY